MKIPLILSILFHIALLIFSIVGIPYISPPKIITTQVSVELLPVDKISQTNRMAAPVKKPDKAKDIKPPPPQEKQKPPQMKEDKPPALDKPKPPEPKKEEKPPEELPKPPEPVKKPEVKPKPPEKKPEPTKVEKPKPEKDFQTLLKNLTPDTQTPVEETPPSETKEETTPQESAIAQLSDKLTMSEEDALRQQLGRCWNVMAGAEYAETLIVDIRVEITRERTVQSATILDQGRYNSDTPFRAAADAALRALRNPKCTPLEVPPDKYDQWKTTVIRFDPSQFL